MQLLVNGIEFLVCETKANGRNSIEISDDLDVKFGREGVEGSCHNSGFFESQS